MTEHRLIITGATGTLGRAFARDCDVRGIPYLLTSRADLDIADPASAEALLDGVRPWAVINTAGYVRVDDAERDESRCMRENALGVATLARACAARGASFVTFSSDLVFDGASRRPYVERDATGPLNAYGRSKAEAERIALASHPSPLVVRTSAFFGPNDDYNFLTVGLRELRARRPVSAIDDCVVSPTYVPDLVRCTLDLLIDGASGIWHLANSGETTWAGFIRRAAELTEAPASMIQPISTAEAGLDAARPAYSALGSEHGALMPPLDAALLRYAEECATLTQ